MSRCAVSVVRVLSVVVLCGARIYRAEPKRIHPRAIFEPRLLLVPLSCEWVTPRLAIVIMGAS